MLKILVVDDETLVRIGIKSMLNWEEHGYTIVGEADNGERGYQMAKELKPDIVLMDIKMPIMDGIELIQYLLKENLCSGIIVLSSHSDFIYVKKALKLGADDYILKMDLEEDTLLGALNTIRARIEREQRAQKRSSMEEKLHTVNIGYLRKNFIRDLINGITAPDKVEEHFDLLDIALYPENLCCIAVELKSSTFFAQKGVTKQEEQRLHTTIVNLFGEILRNYHHTYVVDMDLFEYVFVCGAPADNQPSRSDYLELANHIRDLATKYVNTEVVAGIGAAQKGYGNIAECVRQAQIAAEYAVVSVSDTIVFYEDISFDDVYTGRSLQEAIYQLDTAFSKMDVHQIINTIGTAMDIVRTTPILTAEAVQEHWHVICYMYRKFLGGILELGGIDQDLYDRMLRNLHKQPKSQRDFISTMAWMRRTSLMIIKPSKNSYALIREIKDYIDEHYNEGLQLDDIAQRFSISPNYLCSLYKKTTGQNFIEYITEVRIEHAKCLLQTTSAKVSEISRMVGYENIYYFSKVFKKVTLETPVAFRQKLQSEKLGNS